MVAATVTIAQSVGWQATRRAAPVSRRRKKKRKTAQRRLWPWLVVVTVVVVALTTFYAVRRGVPPEILDRGRPTEILAHLLDDSEHPLLRSREATWAMTDALVAARPDFLNQRRVTILYPGSGSHITPLDIAHDLIRGEVIDEAVFIYTDIDPAVGDRFAELVGMLRNSGLYSTVDDSAADGERVFRLMYRERPIEVRFAIRPGESSGRYWLPGEARQANVVYHHDIDQTPQRFLIELWQDFYGDGEDRGELFVMAEDLQHDGGISYRTLQRFGLVAWDHVGQVTTVPHGYGHRSQFSVEDFVRNPQLVDDHRELGQYKFPRANLVRFEGELLRDLDRGQRESLVDFLATGGVGRLDPSQMSDSQRWPAKFDVQTIGQHIEPWTQEMVAVVQSFINDRLASDPERQAQWTLSLLRLHWAYYMGTPQSGGNDAGFAAWLTERSDWLKEHLPRHRDRLEAMLLGERRQPWHRGISEYITAVE